MRVVCGSCPLGCTIEVELGGGGPTRVTGHRCPRGEAYAREEVLDPKRILTTSVRVLGGELPLASVRTTHPIPRRLIPAAMAAVRALALPAPVQVGQIALSDLLGTGVALVVTRAVAPRVAVDGGRKTPIMEDERNGEKAQACAERGATAAHPPRAAGAGRGPHGGACTEVRGVGDDDSQ